MLGRICRISLSPDACIRQTESVYGRWGARSLLVAKFVPGFASIASALAGVVGTPLRTFVLFDALGALIWWPGGVSGLAVQLHGTGSARCADGPGQMGLLLLCVAFSVFVARKWWQRQRVVRSLKMPRMSVEELAGLNAQGITPTVIDVREPLLFGQSHIPGASSWLAHQGKGRAAYEHLLPRMQRAWPGRVLRLPRRDSGPRAWPGNCSVRDFTMSGHCPVA